MTELHCTSKLSQPIKPITASDAPKDLMQICVMLNEADRGHSKLSGGT